MDEKRYWEVNEYPVTPTPLNIWEREIAKWRQEKGFITSKGNFMEKLMLVVTEVAECAEAFRAGHGVSEATSDENAEVLRIAYWRAIREEMADTFIRLLDMCGSIPELRQIENAIVAKMEKNTKRPWRHGKLL